MRIRLYCLVSVEGEGVDQREVAAKLSRTCEGTGSERHVYFAVTWTYLPPPYLKQNLPNSPRL